MKTVKWLSCCALLWALALCGTTLAAQRPNVIFILADDLGIGNVGCYGADRFQTPDSRPGSNDLYGDNVAYMDKLVGKLVAELAGAKLPEKVILDGVSFAPQLRGEKGQPRAWAFCQLARMWYAREAAWKLNQAGELFAMTDAPFAEKLVPPDSKDAAVLAARQRLRAVLDRLNPAGGILDDGDGTGRHANRARKGKAGKSSDSANEDE